RALINVPGGSVTEGDSGSVNLDFTLTLSAPPANTVTVDVATADGTAAANQDYTPVAMTVTFAVGEVSKVVSVPILGDVIPEIDEALTLNLTNASKAFIATTTATGTIIDNDPDSDQDGVSD